MPVPAVGPTPCDVLLVGKAPGFEELQRNRPHVGRAGRELKGYCDLRSLPLYSFRLTNLCREFVPPDTRLSPRQILEWEPDLLAEIARTRPRLIITLGADPTRFFLGSGASLSTVHGIPHKPGAFDPGVAYRAPIGACILPVIQPAAGFHSPDSRALIHSDFGEVARVLELIRSGLDSESDTEIGYRVDPYAGREKYRDVTGKEMRAYLLEGGIPPLIALDTEGIVTDRFSIQACKRPGTGCLLRCDQADFAEGIVAIQECANRGSIITGHNIGMYDLAMFRPMGLDLFHAHVHDTLFDAFLFCLEPLGLKPNAWRHLGMRMKSHAETVGGYGRELQIEYLERALTLSRDWGKPEPVFKIEGDGTLKIKNPKPIAARIKTILQAIEKQEEGDGDGNGDEDDSESGESDDGEEKIEGVDPYKRWHAVRQDLPSLVKRVESEIGKMPTGTMRLLWEKDPESALRYSCMDADASFRLYAPFTARLEREGKTHLAEVYSSNMHVFSEMQSNGMPTRRSRLESLRDKMTASMLEIGAAISKTYNDGLPINPKSNPQVGALFTKWGLRGTKKTKAKKPSYGKKSIEHLKFIDDGMSEEEKFKRNLVVLLFKWRECQHTRDMFCKPVLNLLPEDVDECSARGQLLPWGTYQRRLAAKKPNLLAQPKHSIYGQMIRDCYEAPEGHVFLESDLRSIEVCVMAHESADPILIKNLVDAPDFHTPTAARLFEIPPEQVNPKTHRKAAKTTIFGVFFGQSPPGLREQLWQQGLTQYDDDHCESFIDGIKNRVYPGIGRYEKRVERDLRYGVGGKLGKPAPDAGSIRDMWGMQRYLPGIWSEDRGTVAESVRQAMSLRISGGAQGLIQVAMTWLKDEIWKLREEMGIDVRWRLTVHDSLLLTCPEWAAPLVQAVVEEGLTEHCGMKLRVPVRAESKIAKTWGGL